MKKTKYVLAVVFGLGGFTTFILGLPAIASIILFALGAVMVASAYFGWDEKTEQQQKGALEEFTTSPPSKRPTPNQKTVKAQNPIKPEQKPFERYSPIEKGTILTSFEMSIEDKDLLREWSKQKLMAKKLVTRPGYENLWDLLDTATKTTNPRTFNTLAREAIKILQKIPG